MLQITNPATEEVIGAIASDGAESISRKFIKAKAAQPRWAARPMEERIQILRRFGELVEERLDVLARILTREVGKPLGQATGEIKGTLARLEFFLEHAATAVSERIVFDDSSGGMRERITREPLGVIANISAWNYPWFVGSNVFIPALLTGNAVLYKPSEFAALTGQALAQILWDAGVPPDVFALVIGAGEQGSLLLEQPIDGVFFTGSHATGKRIAEAVAGRLLRVQLELGGKDPVYVCEDADPARSAAGLADGAFYNAGQSCCSVERIYVHEAIYDEFVAAFVDTVKGFVVGDPMDPQTYLGPLTRQAQQDVLDAQVADAVDRGAELVLGGHRVHGKGHYYEATVLTQVDHTMAVMRDESFGPIIGIQRVKGDAEAIALMNDTSYGLTAGVYTTDGDRAEGILSQLNAGSVYWNCCDRVSPRLPWSGRQASGLGLTLSVEGITAFTQPKGWHLRRS